MEEYCSGDGRAGFHSMKSWGDGTAEKGERGAGVARRWARARRGWSEGGLERRAVAAIALAAAVAAAQPPPQRAYKQGVEFLLSSVRPLSMVAEPTWCRRLALTYQLSRLECYSPPAPARG